MNGSRPKCRKASAEYNHVACDIDPTNRRANAYQYVTGLCQLRNRCRIRAMGDKAEAKIAYALMKRKPIASFVVELRFRTLTHDDFSEFNKSPPLPTHRADRW